MLTVTNRNDIDDEIMANASDNTSSEFILIPPLFSLADLNFVAAVLIYISVGNTNRVESISKIHKETYERENLIPTLGKYLHRILV